MGFGKPDAERVLVTGASGYIAGHCVRELVEHGYAVRGTVRGPSSESKLEPLRRLVERAGGTLDVVYADLGSDDGWKQAVADCAYVLHVASPFPPGPPEHEDDVVLPAVDGTERVLRACAEIGTVRRVVLTSSIAAAAGGHDSDGHKVFTESDWALPDRCDPYEKSKVLAERAAWDLVDALPDEQRFELVVVNPGFCIGPPLDGTTSTSTSTSLVAVSRLLAREVPGVPRLGFATVDVRDLATAHRLAMESPDAAGKRYICAGEHVWLKQIADLLAEAFGPAGYRVPTRELPYWMVWLVGRFDQTVRLILPRIGKREVMSSERAIRELGWTTRTLRDTIVDTGNSLIDNGIVPSPSR